MADTTLQAIKNLARQLTRSPSETQLTDTELTQFINTFVLNDFPEHLRLDTLKSNLVFYLQPYVDTYSTVTSPDTNPLFNFKNRYIVTQQPMFCDGYPVSWSQSQAQFYSSFPKTQQIIQIGTGNGSNTTFTFTLFPIPFLQNQVTISSVNSNGIAQVLVDYPRLDLPSEGRLGPVGIPQNGPTAPYGTVNYLNGQVTAIFAGPLSAPGANAVVGAAVTSYAAGRPQAVLYFQDTFVFRPVPREPYRIELEVYVLPTELMATDQSPDLQQWWQWIAYGAARKLFQSRMDMESLQNVDAEYRKQEELVLRRQLVQQSKERTSTPFAAQASDLNGQGFFGVGPWPFF